MRESRTLRAMWRGLETDAVRLVRHSHRKRGETDRPRLRSTAPALDPTGDILPPGVALTSNLAVIFTLNQYTTSPPPCWCTPLPFFTIHHWPPLASGFSSHIVHVL